jgi:D-glycero-alpha-D-manno-heptose-7-phosphate kinase
MGFVIRDALLRGDVSEFGGLLHEHWQNKKLRSGRISVANDDRWYDAARDAGAVGGKLIGAGGGGFLMLYCENGTKHDVRAALAAEGLRELSYRFDHEGAKVLVNF